MPIVYNKLFALLKEKGYSTYRIRQEKLIGQGTLTAIKNGTGGLDAKTIARLCEVLDCQPGDLMEYVKEQPEGTLQYILQISVAGERQVVVSEVRLICATDDANVQSQKHYVNAEVSWTMTDLIIGFLL